MVPTNSTCTAKGPTMGKRAPWEDGDAGEWGPPSVTSLTGLAALAESLASAKEENVGIHQVLDQTLLELNNL
ncbi:hypothetical protein AAES_64497 [Amazona aestiva]|uniref:Uncharacterized protein n=1 Tax=Amazona aestiva TaxID=12930 RepID=A0A0Q3RBT0_AMAAE|nr:hypothetical protein AAES_64497 [Amazona aestiva]